MSFYEIIENFYNPLFTTQIQDPKKLLLNIATSSCLNEKKFYADKERTRDELFQALLQIADKEPEFVLQVAYYVRNKLLVRSTSNFILAFATSYDSTKPFCRKYFNYIVKLPSDLIELAEYSQLLRYYLKLEWQGFQNGYQRFIPYENNCRKELNFSKMLQKCGAAKFQEFSLHSLAKYCSEIRRKKIIYRFQELYDPEVRQKRYKQRLKKIQQKDINRMQKKLKKKAQIKQDRLKARQIQKQIQKKLKYGRKPKQLRALERRFITMKDLIKMFHINQPKYNVMCILGCKYPANQDTFKQLFQQDNLQFEKSKCGKRMKLPNIVTWERELSQQNNDKVWDKLLKENRLTYMAMLRNLKNILQGYLSPKAFQLLQQCISNPQAILESKISMLQFYKAQDILIQMKNERANNLYQLINKAYSLNLKNIPTIAGKTHIFVDCTGSMNYEQGNKTLQSQAFVISQLIRMKCEYVEFYVFGGEKNNEPYLRVNFYDEDLYQSVQRCDNASRQIGNYYAMIGQTIQDLLVKPQIFCDNIIIISDMSVQKCFRKKDEFSFDYLLKQYIYDINPRVKIFFMELSGQGYQIINSNENCHLLSGVSERIIEYISYQYVDQIQEVLNFSKTIGNQQIKQQE